MMTDWFRIWTDSNAAKAIASRRGLGKTKHIELKYLRLQEDQIRKSKDEAGVRRATFGGPPDEG